VFVGRTAELTVLAELVEGLRAGTGGVLLAEGEQGIGKSALLRAGLAGVEASGIHLAWGVADELGQRFPLRLIAECLGVGGIEGLVQPAGQCGDGGQSGVAGLSGDPVLAAVEGALALVDRLCAASPMVLVAEDLQWADEASLLVWRRLRRAARQLPLLVVGSCQPGVWSEDLTELRREVQVGGELVELGPLTSTEVAELARHMVGGRPGRRLARVLAQAGGNPLYARELAEALVRDGHVRVDDSVADLAAEPDGLAVPESLAGVVAGRLETLAPDAVEVLRWASVLGPEFSVADLSVVAGRTPGELIEVIAASVSGGVVAESGSRLVFRHEMIRQVLYGGMPVSLRVALHLQAARTLATAGAAPERVAAQLLAAQSEAGEPGAADAAKGWVVDWLASAAPALIYRAPRVADELLRGTLAGMQEDDPRHEVLDTSLVTVACMLLRDEDAQQAGRRVLAGAGNPDRAAEVAWQVAYSLLRGGRAADAAQVMEGARTRPGISEAWAARLRGLDAMILLNKLETQQSATVAAEALQIAERAGDRIAAGYALHVMSMASMIQRDIAGTLNYIDRALRTIEEDPQGTDLRLLLLANKMALLGALDRDGDALTTARLAMVVAERAGTPRLGLIRSVLARIYFDTGQWDDALAELEPAVGPPGTYYLPTMVHGLSALIAGHRGDRNIAAAHLAAVPAEPDTDNFSLPSLHHLLLAQALAAEQAGHLDEAIAVLGQCLRPDAGRQMAGRFLLLPELVRLALAAGDAAAAQAAADAAAQEAESEPLPSKIVAADYCRAQIAGDPEPLLDAARYYEATGRPWYRASALEDAAVLAARRDDTATAREAFNTAVGLYLFLHATWDIRRAEERLRPYGIRRRSTRARPATGWAALTPTEVKVAELVAAGRSNPDIAAELVLSRNTVQTHISHILAKLGARSRVMIVRESIERAAAEHRAAG